MRVAQVGRHLVRDRQLAAALGYRVPRRPAQRLRARPGLARRRRRHAVCAQERGSGSCRASRSICSTRMYCLCLAGLLGITITGDVFNLFVFLEISSLSTYVLIALGQRRKALVAAYQYLVMGTIGATFYVIGIGFLYLDDRHAQPGRSRRAPAGRSGRRARCIAALAFITVGIGLKLALFPLASMVAQRLHVRTVGGDGIPRGHGDQGVGLRADSLLLTLCLAMRWYSERCARRRAACAVGRAAS